MTGERHLQSVLEALARRLSLTRGRLQRGVMRQAHPEEEVSLEDSFLSTMLGDPTSDAEPAAGVEEGLPDVSDPPAIENELAEDTLGTVEPAVKEKKRNRKLNPNQGSTRSRAGRGVKYSLRQQVRPPDRWSKLEGKL